MSEPEQSTGVWRELGLNVSAVQDLRGRVAHAIGKGPLPSVQIALARHGRLALFETFGEGDCDTRYNIFSCTKPLVAAAIWRLMGEGALDITRPVSGYIPSFAANGKQAVTVEQVLCHTAGFPQAPMAEPHWWTREGRLQQMADWFLAWESGSRMEYHALSGHWVLAELIEVASGVDYRQYIQGAITGPLGVPGLALGGENANAGKIAKLGHVGDSPTADELAAVFGRAVDIPDSRDDGLLIFNEPRVRALGIPGGGAVATAADVALFYQGLLQNTGNTFDEAVLADALGRVRVDHADPITGIAANRGLGVVIAGDGPEKVYRGMGQRVSARAFGHQGVGGQLAWGDPQTGLSFCLLTNGLDVNPIRSARFGSSVNNRAGACVPAGQRGAEAAH